MDWDAILANTRKPTIRIVNDEYCPSCRRPGSPKVCDENGDWHWKCLSSYEDCKIAYYLPGTTYTEPKLDPDAESTRQYYQKIRDDVQAQLKEHGLLVTTYDADGNAHTEKMTF